MTDATEVTIQLYRSDREGGEGFAFPESDHHYGADIDRLIDELAGGPNELDRKVKPPNFQLAQDARVRLHESGPEVIIPLIEAVAAVVSAITPLLVAWVQKPSREIIIIHAGDVVGRGKLTPNDILDLDFPPGRGGIGNEP